MSPAAAAYVFEDSDLAGAQLAALTQSLDPWTKAGLAEVGIRRGWKVADAGAGSGTIAAWMAGQVGEIGACVATDINLEHLTELAALPGLTVVKHDLTSGGFPGGDYDLIHSRLATIHLRERVDVIRNLVQALAPGGVLVMHEFDCTWPRPVFCDNPADAALFAKVCDGINDVLSLAGAHLVWGTAVHNVMREAGLEQVHTEYHAETFCGGEPWARWAAINTLQLHDRLLGLHRAITVQDLDRFRALMADPHFTATSYLATRVTGRRPTR